MKSRDQDTRLLELAREEFGELTPAEEDLFLKTATGKVADRSAKVEGDSDPAKAEEWGPERVLKADRIVWLCTNPGAVELVTHRGIWVKGARVDGQLELRCADISFPLCLEKSALPQRLNLQDARIRALYLPGTHTGPISADGLEVEGNVFFREGSRAEGEVRLLGTSIGGDLDCSGGQFINKGGEAINADGLKVEGHVFLSSPWQKQSVRGPLTVRRVGWSGTG